MITKRERSIIAKEITELAEKDYETLKRKLKGNILGGHEEKFYTVFNKIYNFYNNETYISIKGRDNITPILLTYEKDGRFATIYDYNTIVSDFNTVDSKIMEYVKGRLCNNGYRLEIPSLGRYYEIRLKNKKTKNRITQNKLIEKNRYKDVKSVPKEIMETLSKSNYYSEIISILKHPDKELIHKHYDLNSISKYGCDYEQILRLKELYSQEILFNIITAIIMENMEEYAYMIEEIKIDRFFNYRIKNGYLTRAHKIVIDYLDNYNILASLTFDL